MPVTLYKDAAKTELVTASGDPVGAMVLTDGTITEFTQPAAANRPIYRSNGTRGWLEFNGTSHHLSASYSPTAYPLTLAVAARQTSLVNSTIISLYQAGGSFKSLVKRNGPSWQYDNFLAGATSQRIVIASNDDPHILIAQDDGTTMSLEVDGGTPSSGANVNAFGAPTTIYIGTLSPVASFFPGEIAGVLIINRLLTDSEKVDVRPKLAASIGVILP